MEEKILKLLENIRPEADYKNSKDYIIDGLIDSFDMTSLIAAIDTEFNITIDETDIEAENFVNLESITKLVEKYLK